MKIVSKRLESLDVLRGFDLFCLTMLCPFLHTFYLTGEYAWFSRLREERVILSMDCENKYFGIGNQGRIRSTNLA